MRYSLCLLVLLAGCGDWQKTGMIRYCEENGIPYRTGPETREDKAGRFITLHGKGYNMTDAGDTANCCG